jgi:arginase
VSYAQISANIVHLPNIAARGLHHGTGNGGRVAAGGIDAGIAWLDAHGDVQTPETTASGFLGGLPLQLLQRTFCPA